MHGTSLEFDEATIPPRPRKSNGPPTPTKPSGLTIEAVMAQNDAIIESATEMLECGCAEDDYLLFIMPLMVLKVLDWYAAAARPMSNPASLSLPSPLSSKDASPPPPSPPRPGTASSEMMPLPMAEYTEQVLQGPSIVIIDGYLIDGEDSERMAAQLVLSKLHRAQRLVNQLSHKLKVQAEKTKKLHAEASSDAGRGDVASSLMQGVEASGGGMRLPLSYSVLDELSVDLRRRLRRLSSEIVEQLRRHRDY
ncbi:hypothetical protein PG997_001932 [Apiospora hydei]|uniref:Aflatoxin regulatory protein domain-containing protein n=1 Tax=Apiospora hydei TaxID=1337664 RepID=A0ABR1X7Y0_9PEZI